MRDGAPHIQMIQPGTHVILARDDALDAAAVPDG